MPFPPTGATLAATEGADAFAGFGLGPTHMLATEGGDSRLIAGGFTTFAALAATEGSDLSDLVGVDTAFGSMAVTAGNDSPAISGVGTAFGFVSLAGGNDSLTAAGMAAAAGSVSLTAGNDSPAAFGAFVASGLVAITASGDSPALAGFSGNLGSIGITESHDTPSMTGGFLAAAVFGMTGSGGELHDAGALGGSFSTSASMLPTEGHDVPAAFSSTLEYHVYSNTGIGDPINYTSAIATTGLLGWTSSPLTSPGVWRFGVRAFNPVSGLEEENLDASITLILDASGRDITNRPLPPTAIRAFATAGGGIRVEWAYNTINPSPVPTGFHVYIGTGGTPNYLSPAATISFQASIAGTFVANLASLENGTTYTVGVRAYNATAEEPNTNTVNVTAASVGPTAVLDLTATAIV